MHELDEFDELFAHGSSDGRSGLARCDIRVRIIVALAAIVAVVMSHCLWFGLIAWACCLVGLAVLRMPPTTLAGRMVGPLALAAVVFAARTLMTGMTPIARIDIGFVQLTATREGLYGGALIACRVLGAWGIVMVLCHDASMRELAAALRWAKMPHTWIEIAVLMYRYLFIFFEQAVCIMSAQRVRLGYSTMRRSFQSMGTLAGTVILHSFDQAERSHEAMTARGYRGFVPLPSLPALLWRQWAIAGAGVALITVAYLLAERWPI
jgi:cobalt/nickel transport system permease protein